MGQSVNVAQMCCKCGANVVQMQCKCGVNVVQTWCKCQFRMCKETHRLPFWSPLWLHFGVSSGSDFGVCGAPTCVFSCKFQIGSGPSAQNKARYRGLTRVHRSMQWGTPVVACRTDGWLEVWFPTPTPRPKKGPLAAKRCSLWTKRDPLFFLAARGALGLFASRGPFRAEFEFELGRGYGYFPSFPNASLMPSLFPEPCQRRLWLKLP